MQAQPNTICNMLQNAIEKVFSVRYDIKGCSRTDSKVHANEYYFNFLTDKNERYYPTKNVAKALNSFLPMDIVVTSCKEVEIAFHARYLCLGKEYIYLIKNTPMRDSFNFGRVLFYNKPINLPLMNMAAEQFLGTHDFSAFCSKYCSVEQRERTIYLFNVTKTKDDVIITVRGDGFLYNMVRIMVGTLLKINEGKMRVDDIVQIIQSKKRENAGVTVKPDGLYLNRVFYDKNELLNSPAVDIESFKAGG